MTDAKTTNTIIENQNEVILKESTDNQLSAVILPARWTAEYATPEHFTSLGIPLMKAIAKKHAPQLFEQIKNLNDDDYERFEKIFTNPDDGFWYEFAKMVAFKENNGLNMARAMGCDPNPHEEDEHYLARLYTDHLDLISAILSRSVVKHLESSTTRNFHVFQSGESVDFLTKKILEISAALLKQIAEKHLKDANYGSFCEVKLLRSEDAVGFLINRAGSLSRPAKVKGKTDKPDYDSQRLQRTDIVLYRRSTNTVWIKTTNKSDVALYQSILNEALGTNSLFVLRRALDLSAIFRKDLSSLLRGYKTSLGFSSLELRSYKFLDHNGLESKTKFDRAEPCQSARLENSPDANPGNTLLEATLRIKIGADDQTITLTLRDITVKASAGVEIKTVDEILTILKVWQPYGN